MLHHELEQNLGLFASKYVKMTGYPDTRENRKQFLDGVLLSMLCMKYDPTVERVIEAVKTEITKIRMEMHFGLD